jgi:hypothetical protein
MTAKIARLVVSEFPPKSVKQHRLRLSPPTRLSAIRAFGLLHVQGFGPSGDLPLGQFPRYHIPHPASQLFQLNQRPSLRQLLLVLPGQTLNHRLELGF